MAEERKKELQPAAAASAALVLGLVVVVMAVAALAAEQALFRWVWASWGPVGILVTVVIEFLAFCWSVVYQAAVTAREKGSSPPRNKR